MERKEEGEEKIQTTLKILSKSLFSKWKKKKRSEKLQRSLAAPRTAFSNFSNFFFSPRKHFFFLFFFPDNKIVIFSNCLSWLISQNSGFSFCSFLSSPSFSPASPLTVPNFASLLPFSFFPNGNKFRTSWPWPEMKRRNVWSSHSNGDWWLQKSSRAEENSSTSDNRKWLISFSNEKKRFFPGKIYARPRAINARFLAYILITFIIRLKIEWIFTDP